MKLSIDQIIKEHQAELTMNNEKKSLYRKRYSPSFKDKVVRLLSQGAKTKEIAKSLNVTNSTLYEWTRNFSNKIPSPHKESLSKASPKTAIKVSSFKELKVCADVGEQLDHFTIETPSGFKINVDSQQKVVAIIRALEMTP
jgi:transposase-like protein